MEPVTIVLAADQQFCRQLAVTLSGISRSTAGVAHRVFVLHDDYDEGLRARVAKSAGADVKLEWLDAQSSALDAAILPAYLPPATLYRLRMEELLPRDVDRVIFLDTDVVIRAPLLDLWSRDLGDAILGAVRDAVYPWVASPSCLDWRKFELAPRAPYFNAGAMLVSLDRWRSEEVGRQALRLLAEHTFRYGDQCALNVVAAQRWDALEPHWNLQSGHLPDDSLAWITEETEDLERARRNPTVIHYTYFFGQKKPWEADCSAVHRDAWFEALDRTAWAGWRPGETRPNPARVAARRVKRAGRVLVGGA